MHCHQLGCMSKPRGGIDDIYAPVKKVTPLSPAKGCSYSEIINNTLGERIDTSTAHAAPPAVIYNVT